MYASWRRGSSSRGPSKVATPPTSPASTSTGRWPREPKGAASPPTRSGTWWPTTSSRMAPSSLRGASSWRRTRSPRRSPEPPDASSTPSTHRSGLPGHLGRGVRVLGGLLELSGGTRAAARQGPVPQWLGPHEAALGPRGALAPPRDPYGARGQEDSRQRGTREAEAAQTPTP